jgi:cobalamin biosynthesis protein CbiG
MTEAELENLRLRLRVEVHQELLRGLYTGLANSSPTAAQGFRNQFAILRQGRSGIAIRGLPPATSDMIAAEYQEALEDVLSNIEAGFHT